MKKNTREQALEMAYSILNFPDSVVDAATEKTAFKLLPLDLLTDEGHQVFAKISITIPDVDGTEKTAPFSYDEAVANYATLAEKRAERAEKSASSKSTNSKKSSEAAERTEKRMKALRDWWNANAEYGVNYFSKDIYNALPELYADDPRGMMVTGTDMKRLAEEGFAEMEMKDKKKSYVKR